MWNPAFIMNSINDHWLNECFTFHHYIQYWKVHYYDREVTHGNFQLNPFRNTCPPENGNGLLFWTKRRMNTNENPFTRIELLILIMFFTRCSFTFWFWWALYFHVIFTIGTSINMCSIITIDCDTNTQKREPIRKYDYIFLAFIMRLKIASFVKMAERLISFDLGCWVLDIDKNRKERKK